MSKFWTAPFREAVVNTTGFISTSWQRWIDSIRLNQLDHEMTHLYRFNDEQRTNDDMQPWEPFADTEPNEAYDNVPTSPLMSLLNDTDHTKPEQSPLMEAAMAPTVEPEEKELLPGMIVLWSGAIANIPFGWALCDGTNGTPNLTDVFVLGAGGIYSVGASGVNTMEDVEEFVLLEDNLPSHAHSISEDGEHTGHVTSYTSAAAGADISAYDRFDEAGAHDHGGSTGLTGTALEMDITPPYYALAYIMKL